MKILGVIPTARRQTAPKVAKMISEVCDHVLIIAKNCSLPQGDYTIVDQSKIHYPHLSGARQYGMLIAINNGFEYILQIDDDIRISNQVLSNMLSILEDEPRFGAITSPSTVQNFWAKDIQTNKPYLMVTHATQVSIFRVAYLKELDRIYASGINTMEDIILGLKLWSRGIPTVRIHQKGQEHNLMISRSSKERGDEAGGHLMSERNDAMPKAIKYIQNHFLGDIVSSASYKIKDGVGKYFLRYNYDQLCLHSMARNGLIGYTDSKGRSF